MTDPAAAGLVWRRSTFCSDGTCVQVALSPADPDVHLRDSKHPDGPELTFTKAEWAVFCAGVRAGEFDAL